jgi:hypothetical protein
MFGHQQSPNLFQKPQTVTFTFAQKRFDKSGELRDENGTVIYRFRDLGEEHTFGFAKSYVSARVGKPLIGQENADAEIAPGDTTSDRQYSDCDNRLAR